MGITIDWKGTETTISSSNAYAIYEDWVQGEIDLSTSQIKACEGFLTDEEIEEIEYENGGDEKTGASSIDTEGTDGSNGAANAAATATATAVAIAGGIVSVCMGGAKIGKDSDKYASENGFKSLTWAIVAAAGAAAVLAMSFFLDPAGGDRKARSDESDSTNSTLDGYTSSLEENFDAMNEDADAYAEATDLYTTSVNENVSKKADLQVQLQAAQAAGDTAGAASLQEEIAACDEEAEDITTDEMDEIQENMDEYASLGSEATGASGSGQSVADFLKPGTVLGAVGYTCGALCAVGAALMGIAGGKGTIPKIPTAFGFADGIPAAASGILFYSAAAMMAAAGTKLLTSADNECEYGRNGDEMQGHVNTLNDMIAEHSEYMEAATESYDETDEESQESQEEAQEAAAEVISNAASTTASTKKKEEEEETTV